MNDVATLASVSLHHGLEFDLRSDGADVIVTHDPFTRGPTIEEFFPHIGSRPCIFNVKCEGVEARVLEEAARNGIDDFFFLDCSVPAAAKLSREGETRIGVRYSEIEPLEGVMAWVGRASWVWVDCFTRFPTDAAAWANIKDHFRVCLVSPELQSHDEQTSAALRASLEGLDYDAVCTKRPEVWGAP